MRLFHGVLTLVALGVVVSTVYFYARHRDNPGLPYQESLRMLKDEAVANPPAGYSREGIERLFRRTLRMFSSDSLNPTQLRKLDSQITGILQDNRLDSLEIKDLLHTLEHLNKEN
ncbi:hypothetical protein MJD09_16360 [bacterium]|nr:hypothetical protein [bacterium]